MLVQAELPDQRFRREIGDLAVWTVTSAKQGNGVELLRDGREDTYWQSDGAQPHLVNIQFQRKVRALPWPIFLAWHAAFCGNLPGHWGYYQHGLGLHDHLTCLHTLAGECGNRHLQPAACWAVKVAAPAALPWAVQLGVICSTKDDACTSVHA